MRAKCSVRQMFASDLWAVVRIDHECFPHPWRFEDYQKYLRRKHLGFGLVAEIDGFVVGFMLCRYDSCGRILKLTNCAVAVDHWRMGIATCMLQHLSEIMSHLPGEVTMAVAFIESNKPAQGLFRSAGFRIVARIPGYFRATNEAAYLMRRDARRLVPYERD